MEKTNTLFVSYKCFNIVLRNSFAKQVYDMKKREDVHAACKKVSYNLSEIMDTHIFEIRGRCIRVIKYGGRGATLQE